MPLGAGSRVMTALTVFQAFVFGVLGSPAPEDWASGAPFHIVPEDRGDTFTSAFINVSREDDLGWKWDRTEVGRYGGGYIGPAYGVIVHISAQSDPNDHSGCHLPLRSSRPDRALPGPGEPWIALIKRGKCNFEVKVENAYKSNAAGVLVYNDRDSAELDKMKLSTDKGRNISAVFTYKWKGEELARLSENNSKVLVHITIAGHTSSRTASINRTSVLFVSITFIVLMIISLAWLVFYYVQRFRYIHAKDRLSKRLCNAAKKALSKIPTKTIKNDDKEMQGDGECCAICIEPYRLSDIIRILPCSHEFHKSCIDPWLLEHRTCPMCKMDILKHYGFVFTGSQESILNLEIEEAAGLDFGLSPDSSPRRNGGISPLPQIRAVIVNDRQRSYGGSSMEGEDQSSRSSSPNEMTPSLSSSNRQMLPVRQDLCVSCIAAAAAAALVTTQNDSNGCRQKKSSSGGEEKTYHSMDDTGCSSDSSDGGGGGQQRLIPTDSDMVSIRSDSNSKVQ